MKRYHVIQKLLVLCIVLSAALAALSGCSKKEGTAGTVSDFESQAHIQVGTSEDASGEPFSGEFVVSEKKYDYNGANLMLLYVENQTNHHYDITIHGTYLDENGEIIEEESQTFEGFASGWSNNFIFYPRKAFDSFTYELETVESAGVTYLAGYPIKTTDENGTPLVSYLTEFTYEKELKWMRDSYIDSNPENTRNIRGLNFTGHVSCKPVNCDIKVGFQLLILDENGEIYITTYDWRDSEWNIARDGVLSIGLPDESGYSAVIEGDEIGSHAVVLKNQEIGEDETLPDTVQGKLTAIFAVTRVYDFDDWMNCEFHKQFLG